MAPRKKKDKEPAVADAPTVEVGTPPEGTGSAPAVEPEAEVNSGKSSKAEVVVTRQKRYDNIQHACNLDFGARL
jgi:hypothetical protein